MRTLYRILCVLMLTALLLRVCQPLMEPDATVPLPTETISAIQEIVETRMAANQIPGFALAVVQEGEMVLPASVR